MMQHSCKSQQSGMALLIVLWVVAALALFVVSLGQVVRSEAGQVNVAKRLLEGRAKGEAAIYLALAQLQELKDANDAYTDLTVTWQDEAIEVELLPVSGLVNALSADKAQWVMLLNKAAGLDQSEAEQLANRILENRALWDAKNSPWEAVEDVLQVPGLSFFVYESIRPYMVAQRGTHQGLNARAAPAVLRKWAIDAGVALTNSGAANHWRVTAVVPFDREGHVHVEREILVTKNDAKRAPWTVLSAREYWRVGPRQ